MNGTVYWPKDEQGTSGCEGALHSEQNKYLQFLQRTNWPEFFLAFFLLLRGMIPKSFFLFDLFVMSAKVQTVSQPGNGHQSKFGLASTSVIQKVNSIYIWGKCEWLEYCDLCWASIEDKVKGCQWAPEVAPFDTHSC